jgi:hypothetical protein
MRMYFVDCERLQLWVLMLQRWSPTLDGILWDALSDARPGG